MGEISLLKKCFCCVPLRYGLIIWGFIELLLVVMLVGVLLYPVFTEETYNATIIGISTAWGLLDIGFSVMLIISVWKRLYKLLQVYYYYAICNSLMALLMFLLTVCFGIVISSFDSSMSKRLEYFLTVCTIPLLTVLLQIYLVLLVRSKLTRLREARQFKYTHNGNEECLITEDPNKKERQPDSTHRTSEIIVQS